MRIERGLTEGTCRLGVAAQDGVVDVISGKEEVAERIVDHLGISSKAVFDNTLSVRQLNLSSPNASELESVGAEIQRVLTGTAQISAAEAITSLEAGRNAVKGRARSVNPREYDEITRCLGAAAEELAKARASRRQIHNLEEEQSRLDEKIARDSDRLQTLGDLIDRHKRWSELKKTESEIGEDHQRVFGTLKKLKDTLKDLSFVQKELEGYADLVGKDEEIGEHLTKIESRRGELEGRLMELEAAGEEETGSVPSGLRIAPFLIVGMVIVIAGLAVGFFVDFKAGLYALLPLVALAAYFIILRRFRMAVEARGGFQHLAELAESARSELSQVSAEERSILTYVKCKDTAKARARVKAYRALADRARELEAALNALLAGRKLEDWEAQERDLDRRLTSIRRQLEDEFAGYSPTTEETEAWRSEFASLGRSLPDARAGLGEVRGALEAERRNARDLAALEGEIEFLHRRKAELEFLHSAYEEAIAALKHVTQTVSEEYLPSLSDQAGRCLSRVTGGRYRSVCVKPGWEISVDCREKSAVEPSSLSVGTVDQLYFALRLSCADLLSAGRKLPVILDDPFMSFDRGRLDKALDVLKLLAADTQILLFTHDPYILDWARSLASSGKPPCLIHELPGP